MSLNQVKHIKQSDYRQKQNFNNFNQTDTFLKILKQNLNVASSNVVVLHHGTPLSVRAYVTKGGGIPYID